jgi:hypothetical protein
MRVTHIDQKKKGCFHIQGPIHKETNIFKDTNIQITFKPLNKISKYFTENIPIQNNLLCSGIYELSYQTCQQVYIEETSREIAT